MSAPLLSAAIAAGEDPHEVVAAAGRRLGVALAPAVSVLDIHDIVVSSYGLPLRMSCAGPPWSRWRARHPGPLGSFGHSAAVESRCRHGPSRRERSRAESRAGGRLTAPSNRNETNNESPKVDREVPALPQ